MSAFGYVGGALAPTVTGYIAQFTGSFIPALLVGHGLWSFPFLCILCRICDQ